MKNKDELNEKSSEVNELEVKDEPVEYDTNTDDRILANTPQSGNKTQEEFDVGTCVNKHEGLEIGDYMISCKEESEENYPEICDANEEDYMKYDPLLVQVTSEPAMDDNIIYNCSKCTYTSNSRHNYVRHVQRHTVIKRFTCQVCERRFSEKRKLRLHEYMHSGRKLFECDLCDYGALREEMFRRHMRNKHAQTGDKQYKCPKCEYQTNDKHYMRKHDFVHEDARPHECEICNRQFKRVHELRSHRFTHEDEKKFQCAHCDYKTVAKTYLAMHLKNKHLRGNSKEYECSECSFKTVYRYNLARHVRSHSKKNEKDFKCLRCSYRTNEMSSLKRHSELHDNPKSYKYLGIFGNFLKEDIKMG